MQSSAPVSFRPKWRHPLVILAVGVAVALVIIVACQQYAAQIYGPTGVRPGSRDYTLAQIANSLSFASTIFIGTFTAGQLRSWLRLRGERERHFALRLALAVELATVPRGDLSLGSSDAYRDPVRLALPARLIDDGVLNAAEDQALIAALLRLQAAVARYNDLVLTNAVVLINGNDARLQDLIRRYWQSVDGAIADVRRLLPGA